MSYPPSFDRACLPALLDFCTLIQTASAPSITSIPVIFLFALTFAPLAFNDEPFDLLAAAAVFEREISSLVF